MEIDHDLTPVETRLATLPHTGVACGPIHASWHGFYCQTVTKTYMWFATIEKLHRGHVKLYQPFQPIQPGSPSWFDRGLTIDLENYDAEFDTTVILKTEFHENNNTLISHPEKHTGKWKNVSIINVTNGPMQIDRARNIAFNCFSPQQPAPIFTMVRNVMVLLCEVRHQQWCATYSKLQENLNKTNKRKWNIKQYRTVFR